jgi:CelD/BcsL family acetyltransferase involved in cellulose biosynthesis
MEKLAVEWEELAGSLQPRTPFTSPLWNILWWKHFHVDSAWVRDELFVHTVRDESGALIAVAPMMLTSRPAFGPVRVRALQLLGADENVTEVRSVIARTQHMAEILAALSKYFQATTVRWDWLQWGGIPDTAQARELLQQAGPIKWGRAVPNYYLPLPAEWEKFRSGLSRNMKEALRKCYNSLKRAGHQFTFRVVSGPAEVAAALAIFFELHGERSRSTALPPHANVFIRPAARDFLLEYSQRLAQRDQLRIFQLVIGGEVVATRVGFLLGPQLYLYYSGYREAWAQHSVMTTVVAESIKWAIQQGLHGVNLSTGRDLSKLRWQPEEIVTREGVQPSSHPLRQLSARAYLRIVEHASANSMLGRLLRSARRAKL